jgi:riboflavin kinase/FMN adenylyltransferase
LLGYSYSVSGIVIEGRKLGRALGFPTANIMPSDQHKLIPCNGVYAVEVSLGGQFYRGMLSIGSNPTVNADSGLRSIEVHILDFNGDIYGRSISVVFRKRLRDEIRFDNVLELTEQMKLDKQLTIRLFS